MCWRANLYPGLQEWGSSKYDPLASLSDWALPPAGAGADGAPAVARYDPMVELIAAARAAKAPRASKYDPLPALLSLSASSGRARYDPAAGLLALAGSPDWQGPTGGARYCMVAAALDAAAGWQAPSGASRYDPAAALLAAEAPTKAAYSGLQGWWDPAAWLLNDWAANSSSWVVEASRTRASSKFDPTGQLLRMSGPGSHRQHPPKYDPASGVLAGEGATAAS